MVRSTLEINVQNLRGLRDINAELEKMRKGAAGTRPRATTPDGTGPNDPLVARIAYQATWQFFNAIRQTFLAASRAVSTGISNLTGSLGSIASAGGVATVAVVGLGAAVAGLAVPIINLVAGFRLLRTAFDWAQQSAENQITVAARTRRFIPEALGEGLEAAEDEMRIRMNVSTALFGQAADSMQEQITRRFTDMRLGRGLRGERDIFSRWGITPESLRRYETLTRSRVDLNRWLQLFVLKREELERQLAQAQTPAEAALIRRRLALLADDTTKIFGQKFSDAVGSMTSRDLARLDYNFRRSSALAQVEGISNEQATRNSIDFRIALESLKRTFLDITEGVGAGVQPTVTAFMEAMDNKLVDTQVGGEGLGRMFRDLAIEMSNNAWRALKTLMDQINPDVVSNWIRIVQSWNPEETAETIRNIFTGIVALTRGLGWVINAVDRFIDILPTWVTGRTTEDVERRRAARAEREARDVAEADGGGIGAMDAVTAGPSPMSGSTAATPAPPLEPSLPAPAAAGSAGGVSAEDQRPGFRRMIDSWVGATGQQPLSPLSSAAAPTPPAAPEPTQAAPGAGIAPGAPGAAATGAQPAETAATPDQQRSWLRRSWDWLRGNREPPQAEAQPPIQNQAANIDALKSTAAGQAVMASADIERGPGGDNLVIRTRADEAAAPGDGSPGFGMLGMMQRDQLAGYPMRDAMRGWLGVEGEQGEFGPPPEGETTANQGQGQSILTSPWGGFAASQYGGITPQDGEAFGTAAAESLKNGLNGVSIGGASATSYGVAPYRAPQPTGGDTASEA